MPQPKKVPGPIDQYLKIAQELKDQADRITEDIVSENLRWTLDEGDVDTMAVFKQGMEIVIDPKTRNLTFGAKRGMMKFVIPPDQQKEDGADV